MPFVLMSNILMIQRDIFLHQWYFESYELQLQQDSKYHWFKKMPLWIINIFDINTKGTQN